MEGQKTNTLKYLSPVGGWFNDEILGCHFLVHEGGVVIMFYVLQEPKSGKPKFYH